MPQGAPPAPLVESQKINSKIRAVQKKMADNFNTFFANQTVGNLDHFNPNSR